MNKLFLPIVLVLSLGCAAEPVPIGELISDIGEYGSTRIRTQGYLCADGTTTYLATTKLCGDWEAGSFVPLTLTDSLRDSLEELASLDSAVCVYGRLNPPDKDAIIFSKGIQLSISIEVEEVTVCSR